MAVSLKIILHSRKYDDGTQPVMLQCIHTAPTGNVWKRRMLCKVKPAQFDKAISRIKNHPNKTLLNAKITEAYNEAEKRLLKAEEAEKRLLKGESGGEPIDAAYIIGTGFEVVSTVGKLINHARQYVDRCRQKGQYHTAIKYEGHVNKIAGYLGKDKKGDQVDIHMDSIDEQWILSWSTWLKSNGTKSANTMHRRMSFMSTLFKDARKRGLTKSDPMVFLEFKEQKVRKPKLTIKQIDALQAIPLAGSQDDARNTFILQFYAYGSRISDALNWRKSNVYKEGPVWYLQYTSMKTGDLCDVRLSDKAKELVSRYLEEVPGEFLLPWLAKFVFLPNLTDQQNKNRLIMQIDVKTNTINRNLKRVAAKLCWGDINLSTHIARHTFATLADSRISDKRKISAALKHTNFSTTEVYLSELRQTDVNDAMEELWK